MAKAIMIQGTMSNAGKSVFTAGLCRIFKQDGFRVAPFKSQNMALNSFITKEGLEMGRAQVVQAEAAGIEPSVLMNPILLKPTSDVGSQVIVNGEVLGNMTAAKYFEYKSKLVPEIMKAYNTLSENNDIIVIEGAGSPAEINLKEQDIVNMGMAKMANAPVLLVADIDRGGVFASIYGTIMLLEDDERAMLKGTVINKFRGDIEILKPGLRMIEEKTNVPVIGVVPYLKLDIEDEDSLTERFDNCKEVALVDIAVIKLPRISNFTDFNAFELIPGVSLRYVTDVSQLKNPDMIILPGTKNTIGDLLWLRQNGLEAEILKHAANKTVIFGVCGGYQMLGKNLDDPYNIEHGGSIKGMGLLDVSTVFENQKTRTQVNGEFNKIKGVFSKLSALPFTGYEIHMGVTETSEEDALVLIKSNNGVADFKADGFTNGSVMGSYIHGIFDGDGIAQTIVECLLNKKGLDASNISRISFKEYKEQQYDKLAEAIRNSVDIAMIYKILNEGV
jgi:adenosylcobyric acid synthase